MPGEGVSRANPTEFCCGNLPKQALACSPRQGGAWLDGGRKQPSTTATLRKSKALSLPNSGCSSTLQLGPWPCLFLQASNLTLLTHNPRSKSREQAGSPLPRLFRSTAILSLPPASKTQPPNPESYFPTLRKEGMPTHRKASVAQSHPGRKPRWEAAGHLLVKEETVSWAPWTRPTLGSISHLHTTNLAVTAVQTHSRAGSAPSLTQPLAAEVAGGGQEPGLESSLPSEITGPLPVWSHLCTFISLVQTETGPFSLPSCIWGIVMLADAGKAEAVDAVSFQIQLEALGQHPMPCLSLCTWLANLEPTAMPLGLLLLRGRLRVPCPPPLALEACS